MSFKNLELQEELLKAIDEQGYTEATSIHLFLREMIFWRVPKQVQEKQLVLLYRSFSV